VTKQHPLEDIPWEGDLQETANSKIQSSWLASPRKPLVAKDENVVQDTDGRVGVNQLSSTDSVNENDIYLEQETEQNDTDKPLHQSTITRTERMAFERIFEDIMERGKSSKSEKTLIVSSRSAGRAASPDPLTMSRTPEEMMSAISRYPASLRAAAARAVGLASDSGRELSDPTSDASEIEKLRQPELKRVEGLMRAAMTDVELWQVMEQEVFSLIQKLGLEEDSFDRGEKRTSRRRRTKKEVSKAADESNTSTNEPLDLAIYGSLYPSHLLLGLQLLDQSFTKPSLLALNVLPRIKSLGLISHVLGASTALYNELLRIYCFRYDNFTGAIDLLTEMEQGALDFDGETLAIVDEVDSMQREAVRGDNGPSLQALWSMPEFAPGKFEEWKVKIAASLDGRGSNFSDGTVYA
jgi:hypothetical protein